ncbi:MAG: TMEM165/GDT1 family protein [Acidimicrobiales bacterium]
MAVLFASGAVALVRAARRGRRQEEGEATPEPAGTAQAVVGSFALVVVAEWSDLTQLATASLAAAGGNPVGIGVGALLALSSVAALAVTVGRQLVARVPLHVVNLVAAVVFAGLAVYTVVRLVR